jgi:hypothetical protein
LKYDNKLNFANETLWKPQGPPDFVPYANSGIDMSRFVRTYVPTYICLNVTTYDVHVAFSTLKRSPVSIRLRKDKRIGLVEKKILTLNILITLLF